MIGHAGQVIYVGKARNLKNRVSSYFSGQKDPKTAQMVTQITDIEITCTATEQEALLLECELIKAQRPKYNVLFKDDKSYPYIRLSTEESFPQMSAYRGQCELPGLYFGPFPSVRAVRDTLDILFRIFRLRSCETSVFKSRTRPCLQYQIGRCSAPCVGLISRDDYAHDIAQATLFLQGKTDKLMQSLATKMDLAADRQAYEVAARYRDRIASLRLIQQQQVVVDEQQRDNIDVLALATVATHNCIHVLSVRAGRILGSRQYFATGETVDTSAAAILQRFILQHYQALPPGTLPPEVILTSERLTQAELIQDCLASAGYANIQLLTELGVHGQQWLQMAQNSAINACRSRVNQAQLLAQQFSELAVAMQCQALTRITCFDVSHTQGEATQAACVVFTDSGPDKAQYRRFSIRTASRGDDYAAIAEAVSRYLKRETPLPDLLLIDGGRGQLSRVEQVFSELGLPVIPLLGIAKGPAREVGLERLYCNSRGDRLMLEPSSQAFALLATIRDEAHRFAITGHRSKRQKARVTSALQAIPGVGTVLRRRLLSHFGGLQAVRAASLEALAAVPGISKKLAQRIFDALHSA